jgi:hypothetical protein
MFAVTAERPFNSIYFLSERPQGDSWDVQEGVELDLPANYGTWPEGGECPQEILCRSTSDRNLFKVFKFKKDIDPREFEPTGKKFGGIFSKTSWERFMKALTAAEEILSIPDNDPPEAVDEAIRAIREGR